MWLMLLFLIAGKKYEHDRDSHQFLLEASLNYYKCLLNIMKLVFNCAIN